MSMQWIEDYKKGLKGVSVDTWIDAWFYRPLAFLVVQLVKNRNITPTQITVMSMVMGVLVPVLLWFNFFVTAVIAYNMALVFDCADGQLARLKGQSSLFGRVVDGFSDYITQTISLLSFYIYAYDYMYFNVNVFVFFGLAIIAGIAMVKQAQDIDYYRTMYLAQSKDMIASWNEEMGEVKQEREQSGLLKKLMYTVYESYLENQIKEYKKDPVDGITAKHVTRRGFYCTSAHVFLFSACILTMHLGYYFIIAAVLFPIYMKTLKKYNK